MIAVLQTTLTKTPQHPYTQEATGTSTSVTATALYTEGCRLVINTKNVTATALYTGGCEHGYSSAPLHLTALLVLGAHPYQTDGYD